ncbi:MarR family transcriptional regulator [Kroppenstedtia pulmonis]|uniref:MarR family transcriptional regulator n=1 Tax=Kroppenstedtia pulmonis TaxID=1380685 RepID=A0A7D3Y2Q0_9BACL|nr:MarR family transcriptional regulator [Kroppenstedtia pulmonis]
MILQLKRLERHPRTYGEVGPLTPSEIHTIDEIGVDGGLLMSQLAVRLGVTKGAVTQIVSRLEMKKIVKREPCPHDARSVVASLTEKGKLAYKLHQEQHQNFYQQLSNEFDQKEMAIFEKCLEKLNQLLRE